MNKHIIGGLLIASSFLMGGCGKPTPIAVIDSAKMAERVTFETNRGNNSEAASTAKGFVTIFTESFKDQSIDAFLRLEAEDVSNEKYQKGGDLTEFRQAVSYASLMVAVSDSTWNGLTPDGRKTMLVSWLKALRNIYPNSGQNVEVRNQVRKLGEASQCNSCTEPKIVLE